MNLRKTLSFATAISLGAFGALGCGSTDPVNPDAAQGADAVQVPDADTGPVCTDLTAGAQVAVSPVQFNYEIDADRLGLVQFYDGAAGTFDLAAGVDANFETCVNCFLVVEPIENGKVWFQSGGTLTLTSLPGDGSVAGTVSDLTLIEVTIDPDTAVSTPVVGGTCLNLGSFALAVDLPPAAANDKCDAAVAIAVPSTTAGTNTGGRNDIEDGLIGEEEGVGVTCTGYPQEGGDVSYVVPLLAGVSYVFTATPTATSPDLDLAIALLGPGDATVCTEPVACLVGADATVDGEAETFTFTPTTSGDYFVIVDSFWDRFNVSGTGDFDLTVAVAVAP